MNFSNRYNPSSCNTALGLTQPVTKMSARNPPGGKGGLVRTADNIFAICERLYSKCGSLDVSQTYVSPWPVTGIALPILGFY
jgi:hypothetical protein